MSRKKAEWMLMTDDDVSWGVSTFFLISCSFFFTYIFFYTREVRHVATTTTKKGPRDVDDDVSWAIGNGNIFVLRAQTTVNCRLDP